MAVDTETPEQFVGQFVVDLGATVQAGMVSIGNLFDSSLVAPDTWLNSARYGLTSKISPSSFAPQDWVTP
jgi:hypothetical protein